MVEQISVTTIVGLLAACLGALLALRFQSSYWKNVHTQHEGWEHAQQGHHRSWEEKQEKLIAEAETRLTAQVQQLRNDWHRWEEKDTDRIAEQIRQQEMSDEHARLERELARLPRVEETSMVLETTHSQKQTSTYWRPAMLQGANLAGHDLSHRYLGRADMRNAQLSRTNFFMADLSGACLADADLSEADLSGANLSNADLRGATLTGANLLVADLNNAILTGANLYGARNLTTRQVYTAIYDSTTQLDEEIDITVPRTSSMRSIAHEFPSTPPNTEKPDQADTVLPEDAEPYIETMYEETMPALAVVKLEPAHTTTPALSQPMPDTTDEETALSPVEPEPLPLSPSTVDDSSPSPEKIDILLNKQADKPAKEPAQPVRKAKYHGRKRARVS
ncbi:MAG: pentapeptide repeat-containing protein [Ktedonobacteraceae bacterium]